MCKVCCFLEEDHGEERATDVSEQQKRAPTGYCPKSSGIIPFEALFVNETPTLYQSEGSCIQRKVSEIKVKI